MANGNYLTYPVEKRHSENILVYSMVFWGMMSFFYHFQYLSGGGFGPLLNSIHFPILGVLFLIMLVLSKNKTVLNKTGVNRNIAIFWTLCSFVYIIMGALWVTFFGLLSDILTMSLILLFILLRDDLKLRIFEGFINVMAILLLFSMAEFLIYIFTGFRYIVFDNLLYLEERPLVQTFFNLMYTDNPYGLGGMFGFFRFQSLADEPGGVGTIMGFLLFATVGNPKYKRQYFIFWMAGLLSFSLAFYIMAFVHLLVSIRNKSNWAFLLVFVVAATVLYMMFSDVFNLLIIDRVSGNDVSEIDNRTTEQLNKDLINAFRDGSILFGHETVAESGAKGVLYNRGLIGVLALVFGYSFSFWSKIKSLKVKSAMFAFIFLVVFWMSYYQRAGILMFQYVIPFFCMPVVLKYKETINRIG